MATFAVGYSENSQVYIGSIIKFDDEDALIFSMEHGDGRPLNTRNVLKWPTQRGEVWIARRDILCLIPEPVPTKITASKIQVYVPQNSMAPQNIQV